jgi:hypothetical protein
MLKNWPFKTSRAVATTSALVLLGSLLGAPVAAQRASEASQPVQPAGGRGGRGGPPPAPRAGAPVDLTGTWVSVVTEDWQWRMRTPPKGDFASVGGLMTPEARRVADTWEPSMDGKCEAYGVGGVMRMPLRVRIGWQDDLTLKIETDAGQQTRLLRFAPVGPGPAAGTGAGTSTAQPVSAPGPRTLQGTSVAEWQRSGGAFDAFLERGSSAAPGQRWGSLKVVTTNMLAGWLRRNGVPYGQSATVTEYFTRFTHREAGDWFVVTTIVEDPVYLTQPFITSSNFKKEPNDTKWAPTNCRS